LAPFSLKFDIFSEIFPNIRNMITLRLILGKKIKNTKKNSEIHLRSFEVDYFFRILYKNILWMRTEKNAVN